MRPLLLSILPLFVLLGAVTAQARGGSPAGDKARSEQALQLLDNGVNLFKAGDLERARVALEKAVELTPDRANPYRWLGFVESRLGHCAAAIRAFDNFLKRVPPGDPRTVELVTLRERCRVELEPKAGTLVVDTAPSGAQVRLKDGSAPLGTTPLRAESVAAGPHLLEIARSGYRSALREVLVEDGQTVRLDLVLEPLPPPAPPPPKKKRRLWIIGAVLGPVAAAALGVGLGFGLTREQPRTLPALVMEGP